MTAPVASVVLLLLTPLGPVTIPMYSMSQCVYEANRIVEKARRSPDEAGLRTMRYPHSWECIETGFASPGQATP